MVTSVVIGILYFGLSLIFFLNFTPFRRFLFFLKSPLNIVLFNWIFTYSNNFYHTTFAAAKHHHSNGLSAWLRRQQRHQNGDAKVQSRCIQLPDYFVCLPNISWLSEYFYLSRFPYISIAISCFVFYYRIIVGIRIYWMRWS